MKRRGGPNLSNELGKALFEVANRTKWFKLLEWDEVFRNEHG